MIIGADATTDAGILLDQRAALPRLPAAPRLLFRVQPDPDSSSVVAVKNRR